MKTLLKLLTLCVCICMMGSCDLIWGWPDPPIEDDSNQTLVIPVNAYFNTTFSRNIIPDGHTDLKGKVFQLAQTGTGTDTEIGYFRVSLTCYWSITDCVPGRSGGILTDGMGNTLFIKCTECLSTGELTADYPTDQKHLTGKFEFIGGSGLYEGATGEGTIDAYVTNNGNVAAISHHWKGYLKSPK